MPLDNNGNMQEQSSGSPDATQFCGKSQIQWSDTLLDDTVGGFRLHSESSS